jgi:quinol monooxygenase YgiN
MEITMVRLQGDAEAIHRAWRERLLPVATPRAAEYGWTRSLVARGDGELIVVNVWRDAEGLEAAMRDPEIARVEQEELAPLAATTPEVTRLVVVEDLTF